MNVHDFTRERNVEARMTLAAARRGLAAAINDAENGIGHLSCDDPKKNGDLMLRVRYDSGAELAGPAIITDEENMLVSLGGAASMLVRRADGSLPLHVVSVEMLSDGSMPEGVESVSIRPKHPKGGLPLTDDMAYMAVTAMLRDAVGLPLNEAADRYEAWLNRVRRNAIEDWVDSLPERESTRLHRRYLDRDGAGRPEEEGDA